MNLQVKAKSELMKILIEKGYTLPEIAKNLGIHYQTARKLLYGQTVLPSTARRICDVLNVSMWDYFEIAEEKKTK